MSPVLPQISSVTSESLQAEVRRLLPSQQGFGADLQATNVIVPIVDLTAAAEGSSVPRQLQEAQAFVSQTAFDINNATTTIVNTAGFYRVQGVANILGAGTTVSAITINMSDGLSTKQLYEYTAIVSSSSVGSITFANSNDVDITVFLRSGDSLSATSTNTFATFAGSVRQIADVNGNLVNPSGFTPQ